MTNSTSQKIVDSTYTKNNMTYLVVNDETIRKEENLIKFLGGEIMFDTSLVTDISYLFAYRNLVNCQDSFEDWDLSNVTKAERVFSYALNLPMTALYKVTECLDYHSRFRFLMQRSSEILSLY